MGITASFRNMGDPVGAKILNGMCTDASLPVEDTATVRLSLGLPSTAECLIQLDVVLHLGAPS